MTVTAGALMQVGTRVRIRPGPFPLDPAALGRTGVLVDSSEYRPHSYGVVLDGETEARYFTRAELETLQPWTLPAEREAAKRRPALP
ncbi:MAG: hypothetical protein HY703_03860 [Gemmatimonadetes bacterium]|nr:hypothetical protein [Gemmatimonadota bacterium]